MIVEGGRIRCNWGLQLGELTFSWLSSALKNILFPRKRTSKLLSIMLISVVLFSANNAISQNCEVDFAGIANLDFSTTCGGTSDNLDLGKNIPFDDNDLFTFDAPSVINVQGNFNVQSQGSGTIIIPAGVTVVVDGSMQLNPSNGGCEAGNQCVFRIIVNGYLQVNGSILQNNINSVIWEGTGTVEVKDQFQNSSNGCMDCSVSSCPEFPAGSGGCNDDGVGCATNFCNSKYGVTCATDGVDPVISNCPGDLMVPAAGSCDAQVYWTEPTATDNCTLASFSSSHKPGDFFPLGNTVVTYVAVDDNGNTTSCSFQVTVQDVTNPTITGCPADQVVSADPSSCGVVVNWTPPTAIDNCNVTLTSSHTPGDAFPLGITTVTYSAIDDNGNTANCSFQVTVIDNVDPLIENCPSDQLVSASAGICGASVNWTPPSAIDNCALSSFTSSHNSGDIFPIGTTTVTYTAFDNNGNSTICSFDITVEDNTNPVISGCPISQTVSAGSSDCEVIVNWTPPIATDNCNVASFTSTHNPGEAFPLGTTVVTYTAIDNNGNATLCSFDITVEDLTDPIIAGCPSDQIVSANGSCEARVFWATPSITDNCGITSITSSHNSGALFPLGSTTVTYTATDNDGNIASCSFQVNVVDNTDPIISGCPSNLVLPAISGSCGAVVNWTPPTAVDNCNVASITSSHDPGDTFPIGITTVTYTATDDNGNTSNCSFDVEIIDNVNPVINNCPIDQVVSSASGSCGAVVTWNPPTADDNCNVASFTSSHNPGESFPLGITTVSYTATDDFGNATTCSFQIEVIDDTAPVIASCPSDISINADLGTCGAVVSWNPPVAVDNCNIALYTSNYDPGDVFPVGQTTVTYTAIDNNGNTSVCSFQIEVIDNILPTINGCPADIVVSAASGSCDARATWATPFANDNCSMASFTSSHNPGEAFPLGSTMVTYTAIDLNGNTATCSFEVKVVDNTAPVITGCPSDISVIANSCTGNSITWTPPNVTDNCNVASFTSNYDPGDLFPLGVTTVTYTAVDDNGNTSECSFEIEVWDDIDPVITNCPADIVISTNGGNCEASVTWTAPTASDNCNLSSFTSTHNSGDSFPLGQTAVTYTATDDNGNTAVCSFLIEVIDTVEPIINNCPADMVVSTDPDICGAIVDWEPPTAFDNCYVFASFGSSHDPGDYFPVGQTLVSYTAIDELGNASMCTFMVEVVDNIDPVISACPADMVVSAADGICEAIVNWAPPFATDNCAVASFTSTHNPGDSFPLGTTTVTYTAEDTEGNSASCSFQVEVEDNTAPVIIDCPIDMQVSASSCLGSEVSWTPPTVTDNCNVASFSSSHSPGDNFPLGITQVTYTAIDDFGNTTECSFQVNIVDDVSPIISDCPMDMVIYVDECATESVDWVPPTATDNCNVASLTSNYSPGDVLDLGVTTVVYTATDDNGNTATCSFEIELIDNTDPVITNCPTDIVVAASDNCNVSVDWIEPIAIDNCTIDSLTSSHQSGDLFPLGATTVTYTALDQSGNSVSCSFTVTVEDRSAPEFVVCMEDKLVPGFDPNDNQATVSWEEPEVIDNCALASVSSTHVSGSKFPEGQTLVTYTALDEAGNEQTCSFTIEVVGNNTPTGDDVVTQTNSSDPIRICLNASDLDNDVISLANLDYDQSSGFVDQLEPVQQCFVYTPALGATGVVTLTATVCDDRDPAACAELTITIEVLQEDIDVYKAFSPNGDGINDVWVIGKIEQHPENSVIIFDRWGSIIYEAKGYNNENIVWDGTGNSSRAPSSGVVPAGTYFYSINLEGSSRLKGSLELVK